MKNRLKIYSYVLFLANIILFAHSFVPHGHLHEQSLRSVVEKSVGEGVLNCGCSACSKFISVVENISVPISDDENCGCCSTRKGNCYISAGYIHHDFNDNNNLPIVAIAPSAIVLPTISLTAETIYVEVPIDIPRRVAIRGFSLRAPPQLFS